MMRRFWSGLEVLDEDLLRLASKVAAGWTQLTGLSLYLLCAGIVGVAATCFLLMILAGRDRIFDCFILAITFPRILLHVSHDGDWRDGRDLSGRGRMPRLMRLFMASMTVFVVGTAIAILAVSNYELRDALNEAVVFLFTAEIYLDSVDPLPPDPARKSLLSRIRDVLASAGTPVEAGS
jgi:hypothetical protein